jgi:hypothetical protein
MKEYKEQDSSGSLGEINQNVIEAENENRTFGKGFVSKA